MKDIIIKDSQITHISLDDKENYPLSLSILIERLGPDEIIKLFKMKDDNVKFDLVVKLREE